MTLPVRIPQASGHAERTRPVGPTISPTFEFVADVAPARTIKVPNRRWAAQRAEVLVQIARGRLLRAERGLL